MNDKINARLIEKYVTKHLKRGVTISDVATRTGLPFFEVEIALKALLGQYDGHISVTQEGDLVFCFPRAFKRRFSFNLFALNFGGKNRIARDQLQTYKKLLLVLRVYQGRVGWSDVLRYTGLEKNDCEKILRELCSRFKGEIKTNDDGTSIFFFAELRKSARINPERARKYELKSLNECWKTQRLKPANSCSWGFTIPFMFMGLAGLFSISSTSGVTDILGTLLFSFSFGTIPVLIKLSTDQAVRKINAYNGRLGLLKTLFKELEQRDYISEAKLLAAWRSFCGQQVNIQDMTREITKLGGDALVGNRNTLQFRFPELRSELQFLKAERSNAEDAEAHLAKCVYSSKLNR